jgi:hypothetical protein
MRRTVVLSEDAELSRVRPLQGQSIRKARSRYRGPFSFITNQADYAMLFVYIS